MSLARRFGVDRTHISDARCGALRIGDVADDGYVLLAVLVLIFLMLLTLSIAAPRIAMQLKHDQELETQNRAKQYVRAIRMFHKKTGNYPTSIEQLEKTNNQRFLRQRYLDPLTGKDDWKLIQVGQNKTTVKGFFGKDLPGLGGGLGAAAGMQSNMGGSSTSGSTFGSASSFGSGSSFGSSGGAGSTPGSGSSFGNSTAQPTGSTFGGSNGGQAANGTTSGSNSGTANGGIQSIDASDAKGSTGPIMGVGVPKEGEAFLSVNGVSTYQEWEFLYDPRIELLYAQHGAPGGGGGTLGTAPTSTSLTGLGNLNNPSGQPGGANPNGPAGGNPGQGQGGNGSPTNPPPGTSPQ